MRYGQAHARLAEALAWLLTHPQAGHRDHRDRGNDHHDELRAVLSCRSAVLLAAQQMLEQAIRGADGDRVWFNRAHRGLHLRSFAAACPVVLGELLEAVPRHADQLPALTDVLTQPLNNARLRAWAEAARHATLAADTLATAPGWTSNGGRAWQVVADVATTTQAIATLDADLSTQASDLLPGWSKQHRLEAPGLVMVANHTAALARSGRLDPGTDTLTAAPPVRQPIPLTDPRPAR